MGYGSLVAIFYGLVDCEQKICRLITLSTLPIRENKQSNKVWQKLVISKLLVFSSHILTVHLHTRI